MLFEAVVGEPGVLLTTVPLEAVYERPVEALPGKIDELLPAETTMLEERPVPVTIGAVVVNVNLVKDSVP